LALEAFQEAVSLDPTYRDVGVGLAYALFELGRYREALPHLHRLTRESAYLYFPDPDSDVEEVRSRYARCLYYTGGISKPARSLPGGSRPAPNGRASTMGLGWTYLKLGGTAPRRGRVSSGRSGLTRSTPTPVPVWRRPAANRVNGP